MPQENTEIKGFVPLENIYISVARSLDKANKALESEGSDDISYAIVESDFSLPYTDIIHNQNNIHIKLPEVGSTTAGLQRMAFKVKPVPRSLPPEKKEFVLPTTIPNVLKLNISEALETLISRGYRIGKMTYDPEAKPEGIIISQTPEAGKEAPLGTMVDLKISRDSLRIIIPPEAIKPKTAKPVTPSQEKRPPGKR
jgi:hypothetical protein